MMGLNSWLVERMPVVGQDAHSCLAIYHQGNLPGATSAVYLFPESQSGIVVLTNAYRLSDVTDWISQAIMDMLFHHSISVDYIQLTREAIIKYQEHCAKTQHDLVLLQDRKPNQASFDVGSFVGDYRNDADVFIMRVSRHGDDSLRLAFQGLQEETFLLYPSHDKCYTWFSSFLDMAHRGRHIFPASHYIVCFRRNSLGKVMALKWAHNGTNAAGELFFKMEDDGAPRLADTIFSAVALILVSVCLVRELRFLL